MLLSVSELNEYVRKSLAMDPFLQNISIKGEISNFRKYQSGHFYFTLKDDQSAIGCVMFQEYVSSLDSMPKDGMSVELRGSASLYAKTGQYQFYATKLQMAGIGELYTQFEQRKEKLRKLGLFDMSLKKPLPFLPSMVGVISSPSGAVIHDILQVAKIRNSNVSFCLFPAKVQGDGASSSVIRGIQYFNTQKNVDVIIIARGGGSFEDLFEFNSEDLAYAIRASELPIISAVGHETDYTISDFVADVRAATPSHAAELLLKDKTSLKNSILSIQKNLSFIVNRIFANYDNKLKYLHTNLEKQSPKEKILGFAGRLINSKEKMELLLQNQLQKLDSNLQNYQNILNLINPYTILGKGYSIIEKKRKIVDSITQLNLDDEISIRLKDGLVNARIK